MEAKPEIKDDDELEQQIAATPLYRPPIPRMYTWSTDPNLPAFTPLPPLSPWEQHIYYETPTMKRSLPNFSRQHPSALSSTGFM
jgi:hypothetical protein